IAAGAGGLLAYAIAFYALWLTPGERLLIRTLPRRGRAAAA
ncbi:MAG: hypothetical protein QOJ07_1506, partial [Thermoleophilaceae bacterium]|nr:hypothetical protein [Thermoleophilaceae bacterium]